MAHIPRAAAISNAVPDASGTHDMIRYDGEFNRFEMPSRGPAAALGIGVDGGVRDATG